MNKNVEEPESKHITALESMVSVDRISLNISQSVIVTTEDKMRLSLESYIKSLSRKTEWVAPLSLLVAIFATLATANFHDFLLEAATWKAMFVMTGLGAFTWLIRSLLALRDTIPIEELIDELKTGNSNGNSGSSKGDAR